MNRVSAYLILVSLAAIGFGLPTSRAWAEDSAARCKGLLTTDFESIPDAPTDLTRTSVVAAKDGVPDFCRVEGYVAPQVGFDLRLPLQNWNGKFLKVGCGGLCGILYDFVCEAPLQKGYACIVSDLGHKGSTMSGLWAYNNLQAEIDFAFRAVHVATLAGKAIAARYYGAEPKRSYYMGCSQGGRQGLVLAQRFPWDFDGIIAGAPPIDQTALSLNSLTFLRAAKPLTTGAIRLLNKEALAKCDLDDGVADGVIGYPPACRFDPADLICKAGQTGGCLTSQQAQAARTIYGGGTLSSSQKIYGGAAVGSELNWLYGFIDTGLEPGKAPGGRPMTFSWLLESRISYLRYVTFMPDPGPQWTPEDLDVERDYKRRVLMEALLTPSNPDLRKFKRAGGKLMIYTGWNDEGTVPGPIIDYYETVEGTMGGRKATQDFFRLFLMPGVNHCAGGAGADAADFLGYLEKWVEAGEAPDRILAAHTRESMADDDFSNIFRYRPYRRFPTDPAKIVFTRPLYPYPLRAKYTGKGDPNDAKNFRPVQPEPPDQAKRGD